MNITMLPALMAVMAGSGLVAAGVFKIFAIAGRKAVMAIWKFKRNLQSR